MPAGRPSPATSSPSRSTAGGSRCPMGASTTTSASRPSGSAARPCWSRTPAGTSPTTHPPADWPLQMLRVLEVIDNQVRDLRKRQAVASYELGLREGAYWGIRSDVRDYQLADAIP